ncbi:MAG: alpha/beta fold hydrolase [Gammaproteobacteria bacterium]|nr:alpha/beta fold hydrolase [Gammaproteobacteria bacterium]
MQARSRFVDVDGLRTHYLEAGEGEPLVLIHGGGAGADARGNWRSCMPGLAARYRVLAVDMVGFGDTDKPPPSVFEYSQAARNRHLEGFLRVLCLPAAVLVGNSMGGCTALGVAMAAPARVRGLVLMGSAGLNATLSPELRTILGYEPTLENMRTLVATLTAPGFEVDDELLQYRYERTQAAGAMAAYGATMRWIAAQGGLFYPEQDIARVRTPALVINGREDCVVPRELAWRFMELLDNASLHIIAHCGHWAMIEQPQAFTGTVLAWLGLLDASAGEVAPCVA